MKHAVYLTVIFAAAVALSGCAGWPSNHEPTSFWNVHGIWFLIFMNLFPRITMLVMTPFPIGFWCWAGWLFTPRLVAAILATHYYWNTNPVLVVITWIVALGTTGAMSQYTTNKTINRG